MAQNPTNVIIIGAGYAGLLAAVRLAGKTKDQSVTVTLINPIAEVVERPRLHEIATDHQPKVHSLSRFLNGTGIQFIKGIVTALDPNQQQITVQADTSTQTLSYDYLLYTLGSAVDRDSVRGVREHAYTLDTSGERSVPALRSKLQSTTNGRVIVIGAGATGIEVAGEIADTFPHLQVSIATSGEFGAFKDRGLQTYMRKAIQRLGIEIIEHARVTSIQADGVTINQREHRQGDIIVWAGGFKARPMAREAGLKVNERDQILVDPFMRSISHPNIFAAGDSAHPVADCGAPIRMGVFPALVMAAHAADTLVRLLHDQPLKPFGFSYFGQAVTLGRHDGVGFLTYPDDKRIGPFYRGSFGLWMRNLFVSLIIELIALESRRPGFFFWLGSNRGQTHEQIAPLQSTAVKG